MVDAGYILAALVTWVPPEQHAYYEPAPVTEARYVAFAGALARVTDSVDEALTLASIASYESALNARVMRCETHGGSVAQPSWGAFQLAGHRAQACDPDLARGAREALSQVRASLAQCRSEPLSRYTVGHCAVREAKAHWRLLRARSWLKGHPAPTMGA